MKTVLRCALLLPLLFGLGGCLSFFSSSNEGSVPAGDRQLPASTQALLAIKGMKLDTPIFVRIFKEESEFEVWKLKDGHFQHFRTYPICAWSGELGPKVQQGDRQAPEGFYTVGRSQMNPHSLYHLAFNIGFPNAFDHANGFTGSALMVHGDCKSAGCYAMTDAYIEEIYILAREAFNAGQSRFHVQAFPFRMTAANMQRHRDNRWFPFWVKLKEGYDAFEGSGKPPVVKVCGRQYLVNVQFSNGAEPSPDAPCPLYAKINPSGIDGVPATALASFSRGETPVRATAPAPVQVASPAPKPESPQAISTAMADMSASPIITRSTPAQAPTQIASVQPKAAVTPKAPPAPVVASAAPITPAPVRAAAPAPVRPVNYAVASSFAAPAPMMAAATAAAPVEQPSKAVDADAIQKPNRTGKGGKLPAPADSNEATR
jgi:murein L,D-transpeptidase YafK